MAFEEESVDCSAKNPEGCFVIDSIHHAGTVGLSVEDMDVSPRVERSGRLLIDEGDTAHGSFCGCCHGSCMGIDTP